MNIAAILKLVEKALNKYKSMYSGDKIKRRILRYRMRANGGALKSIAREAFGGKDYFGNLRLKKEREPKQPKEPKEKKPREYAIYRMWKGLSEGQKKQFREWFRTKAMNQSRVARSFNFEHELRKIQARVKRISNKYFVERKKLTKQEWDFIFEFSEFFGDVDYTQKRQTRVLRKTKGRVQWYHTKSSWLLAFKYEGESGKDKKGTLFVKMIRGKMIYPFPGFPYVEYVMLKNVTGSIGKYWWKKWMWRYSTNASRFGKYWYKGRLRYGK